MVRRVPRYVTYCRYGAARRLRIVESSGDLLRTEQASGGLKTRALCDPTSGMRANSARPNWTWPGQGKTERTRFRYEYGAPQLWHRSIILAFVMIIARIDSKGIADVKIRWPTDARPDEIQRNRRPHASICRQAMRPA